MALFGNPLKITSELLSLLHVSSIGDQRRATDNDFIAVRTQLGPSGNQSDLHPYTSSHKQSIMRINTKHGNKKEHTAISEELMGEKCRIPFN